MLADRAVGRGRGHDDQPRGARDPAPPRAATRPPGVRTDLEIIARARRAPRRGARASGSTSPEEVFDELRARDGRRPADYSGISYERIRASRTASSGPARRADHPGTPRLFAERFAHPRRPARFHAVRAPRRRRAARRRVPALLHDRPLQGALQLGRADPARGARSPTRSPSRACRSTRGWPRGSASPTASALLVESRRGAVTFAVTVIARHPPRHAVRAVSLGRQAAPPTLLTIPALDPTSRMPEFKVCAVRARARQSARGESEPCARRRWRSSATGWRTCRLLDELVARGATRRYDDHRLRRGAGRRLQPHPARQGAGRRRARRDRHQAARAGTSAHGIRLHRRRARHAARHAAQADRDRRRRSATATTWPCSPPAASRWCRRSKG